MNDFTRLILSHFLSRPGIRTTVRAWIEQEPDRNKRAVDLCGVLQREVIDVLNGELLGGEFHDLADKLLEHALRSVNWRRVADELIERFTRRLPANYAPWPSVN